MTSGITSQFDSVIRSCSSAGSTPYSSKVRTELPNKTHSLIHLSLTVCFSTHLFAVIHSRVLPTIGGETRIHRDLVEIFTVEKAIAKPFQLKGPDGHVIRSIENAPRDVTLQPLDWRNVRRLRAEPHHMIRSGSFEKMSSSLKTKMFCNLRFLRTKLHACGVRELVEDFLSLERVDADLVAVSDALQTLLRHKTNDQRLDKLPHTLIEALMERAKKSKYIKFLISQAKMASK